jgi:Cupin-like domain
MHYFEENPGMVDVTVTMKPETLSGMLSGTDKFDLRNPDILMQLTAEGNLDLAGFLFAMIKRPSRDVVSMMKETLDTTVNYKNTITEIKRVNRPSEEEIIQLMDKSVPFVVTGAIENWPFLSMTLQEIKDEYGAVNLRPNVDKNMEEQETLKDFIEKMENNTNELVYTFGCPLPLAIWAEFPLPFFKWDMLTSPQIWMGKKTGDKPCTNLHRDCTHGMLANLFGRKKLILFSPDQSDYLYPVPAYNTFQSCLVTDVQHVDVARFPLFKNAQPVEVTIGPGELLVIPAFWYHCVYAVDNVFSVSFGLLWKSWKTIRPARETA